MTGMYDCRRRAREDDDDKARPKYATLPLALALDREARAIVAGRAPAWALFTKHRCSPPSRVERQLVLLPRRARRGVSG